jgi:hypothetical protein
MSTGARIAAAGGAGFLARVNSAQLLEGCHVGIAETCEG